MVTSIALGDPALFRQQCYVNGGWMDAQGGDVIEVDNPATREIVGTVPAFGREETRAAIEAADAAWSGWRSRPAKERAGLLRRWFELLMAYQDDLAVLMTTEQGKPLAESRGEIAYAASFVEWFAEEAKRVYGDVIDHPLPGKRIVVLKQPIGVVASITPWNFPAAMITRKCAPAFAAGCPVVIRPASQTPFTALAVAELADRAGIPPGVVNVITGPSGPMGAELTSNPTVRKLSFTGSTEVGKLLMSQCAATVKKVTSSWAATPRSSSSTTRTSTRRWPGRWPRSTATRDRPASAPTACWCRTASTTRSPRRWRRRSPIISNEVAPFGGVKESGIGREGSKYGMDDFVEIKYLCLGGIDG